MTQTMLPSPYKVLVDCPEDGAAEERCWVPVEFAPTEEKAIELALAEKVIDADDRLKLEVVGKEWFRRDPAYKPAGNSLWRNEKEDINADYEPWLPCSKYAKTGIEVWTLEVVDVS